jgi:Domain of unknown function (DUF5753)
VSLEDAAERITSYQTTLLPGLLHTADYRRALIWAEFPNKPTDEVERVLEVSLNRRARLTESDKPLTFRAFVDEHALHRITGSVSIMGDQLHHLVEIGTLPNVSVRVVMRSAGTYRALTAGAFVMLDFPLRPTIELTMPPVVYIQGFLGDLYLEQTEEVRKYREVLADLDRIALDEKDSRSLILNVAKESAREP